MGLPGCFWKGNVGWNERWKDEMNSPTSYYLEIHKIVMNQGPRLDEYADVQGYLVRT